MSCLSSRAQQPGDIRTRWTVSALLVTVGAALLSAHPILGALAGRRHAYSLGTVLLLGVMALIAALWPLAGEPGGERRPRALAMALTFAAGFGVLVWSALDLLEPVFAGPPDPRRADMLVVIGRAVDTLLAGRNPYTVHKVPWDVPLAYGPLLWTPHVISRLFRFDFRILTLVAQFVIPALCFLSAAIRAGQRDVVRTVVLFGLGAGAALHPGMMSFHQIGHTQVYWPLLAVFALLLYEQRWTAASICLGLLASARTPLLALAPVFFIYLRVRSALTVTRVAAYAAAALAPYIPFLLVDAAGVKDGVVDSYIRVMKEYVWRSTPWAVETYGITGRLLEHGWEGYVEIVQAASLGVTYIAAWRATRLGRRVEPWLAFSLLVFAMTTLWSVTYIYYDVWLLLVGALLAYDGSWKVLFGTRPSIGIAAASVAAATVVLGSAAIRPGGSLLIDVGERESAGFTGGGFGADVSVRDGNRSMVWIQGTSARVRLPRAGWTGGTIRVALRPHVPHSEQRQRVLASLNGHAIGVATLREGWQVISFATERAHWTYGLNVLELFFDYSAPVDGIVGSDPGEPLDTPGAIDFIAVD